MAVLEGLTINLHANIVGFTQGLRRASVSVERFAKKITSIAKKVAAFGAVMLAAAGGALVVMVKRQLDVVDSLDKMAASIGISSDKLTSLRLAMELGGESAALVDKSLIKMLRTIADANRGLAKQVEVYKILGLKTDELSQLRPDEQFKMVADALLALTNNTERAGAAMDVFGRSGAKLLPLLNIGRAGIEGVEKEAKLLGIAITNIDAKKVANANDAVLLLKKLFVGLARQITIRVAPIIALVADRLKEAGTAGEGMAERVENAFNFVANTLATVATGIDVLNNAMRGTFLQLQSGNLFLFSELAKESETFLDFLSDISSDDSIFKGILANAKRFAAEFAEVAGIESEKKAKAAVDRFMEVFNPNTAGKNLLFRFKKLMDDATEKAKLQVESDLFITAGGEEAFEKRTSVATPGAFRKGSAAAFSAARAAEMNQQKVQENQLKELQRIDKGIRDLDIGLAIASIA